MRRPVGYIAMAASVAAVALAGCSVGGGSTDTAGNPTTLTVTRDFGAARLGQATYAELPAGPTVMRLLQREFDVETSYGGRFVTAIEGLAAKTGPARDWIYYVNGREAEVGAAERRARPGDRVQWDYHRWDAFPVGKAIVGAFPQPFAEAGARLVCMEPRSPGCTAVRKRLVAAGVELRRDGSGVPVVVGAAGELDGDKRFPSLRRPGASSGVFVRVRGDDQVELLNETGRPGRRLAAGEGVVVAAMSELWPVWFVTGIDEPGVSAAAELLDEQTLADRFSVVAGADGEAHDLPVRPDR
jgi:hypothetical protein